MKETLYKITGPEGQAIHGGSGRWPLPKQRADGSWRPGRWIRLDGPIVACAVGLHVVGKEQVFRWWGPQGSVALWEVEVAGQRIDERDKTVVSEARLLCPVDVPAGLRARDLTAYLRMREANVEVQELAKERLVFGVHRIEDPYCPAWPTAAQVQQANRQRTLRLGRKALGLTPAMDRLVKAGIPGAWEMVTQG